MKNRFMQEQIIGVLKEAAAGMKVAEVFRKHDISDATYYNLQLEGQIWRHDGL